MTVEWQFERVAGPFDFTEGPVWLSDPDSEGSLLFSEVPSNRVIRYDPATDGCETYLSGTGGANGLAVNRDGTVYACESTYRRVVAYPGQSETVPLATTYEGGRLNGPNDLCLDGQGSLWFTDPNYSGDSSIQELSAEGIYRLDSNGTLERATDATARPSGIELSPDGDVLYVADARFRGEQVQRLLEFPVASDGTLGEKRALHDFGPHRGIDGFSVASSGEIVAAAGWERSGPGPAIYVLDPDGDVIERHPFPTDRPTNCAFAGRGSSILYTTGGGSLYRTETDLVGHGVSHSFKWKG
ncbi:MAG: SMP-30/gluconolactonase/LRE family protein [Halorhabdus sp.]